MESARKWTDKERELVIKGIERFDIGHFGKIAEEHLPSWASLVAKGIEEQWPSSEKATASWDNSSTPLNDEDIGVE
ncbi:hypothetical protein BGZ65_000877, partial [Modicella reniformis]